ncbi:MAG TPA: hypothetical protein VKA67_04815, partial [Verrucomicrobiae bacterium]|nr:hypothetical protein [Verrucomicrobiae bacterium]
ETVDATAFEGEAIYDANGRRVGVVYDVGSDGSPQVILRGKVYSIPASTLALEEGKLVTSLTKKQIILGK